MHTGLLSHIDFSVGDPSRSIPFYDALLSAVGYQRWRASHQDWQEPNPTEAGWSITYQDGSKFGIVLRPARADSKHRKYDRYEPGPHHMALHVESDEAVDRVRIAMSAVDPEVLDEPKNYGGQPGYGDHYYAVFFADPDGFKVEVVNAPGFGG